jgi:hypothetical protein
MKWATDGEREAHGTDGNRTGAKDTGMANQRTDNMAGEPMRIDDKMKELRRNLVR